MLLEATKCLICGAPLLFHQRLTSRICGKDMCRRKLADVAKDQLCKVCGRPLTIAQKSMGACSSPECQRLHQGRQRYEQERKERVELREQGLQLRERAAIAMAIADPESYPPTPLPSFRRPVVDLPAQRRAAFCEHVRATVAAAMDAAPYVDAAPTGIPMADASPLAILNGHACGACGGHCCRHGDTQAYVMTGTIDRYRAVHPNKSPEEIVEAYCGLLPERSFEDSCVFHAERGCTLPGWMRSDVCNEFLCEELTEFNDASRNLPQPRAFFLPVENRDFVAAVLADGSGARHLKVAELRTASLGPRAQSSVQSSTDP